jgi:septal ring factor EnvC (AmiA/AmiB activator)
MKNFKAIYITMILLIGGSCVILCPNVLLADDIRDQKKELEDIKKELEDSAKRLDSLKSIEKKILKEVSNYEQRASMNKTVLTRLNKQLSELRKDIDVSRNQIEYHESRYTSARNRFLGNLKYYYSGALPGQMEPGNEIVKEKDAFRRLVYLRSLAAYDREDLTRAEDYLKTAEREYDGLVDQEKSTSDIRNKKRSEYTLITTQQEKHKKDLSRLRRRKEDEADRLITLTEEARQMEELIARLEKARQARIRSEVQTQFDFNTGNFVTYKGGLLAPVKGKVVKGFGWKKDQITNLESFSPGIEIKGTKDAPVAAVADGVITYLGNLRGYGNFVIIEHEDGFYSTVAGMDSLTVSQNQLVTRGEKLGISLTGIVKLELRQGRKPLDPIEWIRIDSFR